MTTRLINYSKLAIIFISLLLCSNCDPFVRTNWEISNRTTGNIDIEATIRFNQGPDSNNSISPGTILQLFTEGEIGTAEDELNNRQDIAFETLVITNAAGNTFQKDVQDLSQWIGTKISEEEVEFRLVVRDGDF